MVAAAISAPAAASGVSGAADWAMSASGSCINNINAQMNFQSMCARSAAAGRQAVDHAAVMLELGRWESRDLALVVPAAHPHRLPVKGFVLEARRFSAADIGPPCSFRVTTEAGLSLAK